MAEATKDDRKLQALVGDAVRDALGVEGRQALYSAACLMAFADLELAESETVCLAALSRHLGAAPQGAKVTTRRQSRDQILATFRAAKLGTEAASAILACLAYVAWSDGVVKPEERALFEAVGAVFEKDAAACAKLLERSP